ncbi:hypothetical protein SAMN04490355_10473 [Pelosinus propionicus DSM 13327]|uniref:Uncharacterized protein n=1 Tax=Pelosinus propionicus DSM 13327 TaxID=1123291 RepID=A0A1I4NHT7_9FIRM|nr:hypothetical protein SAMN04490355_10473 [Pelosinus propionicus DSM 13327]
MNAGGEGLFCRHLLLNTSLYKSNMAIPAAPCGQYTVPGLAGCR